MSVSIKRVMLPSEHENQKWLVYEGSVEGVPAVTKRVTIAMAAVVQDPSIVDRARTKLESDVNEYHANFLVLQGMS